VKKRAVKKMKLSTETLRHLGDETMTQAVGGNGSMFNSDCGGCSVPGGICQSVGGCTDPRICR
jgi:hypothetical protein